MSRYSLARQPRLNNEYQIFEPTALRQGDHIGVYEIIRGTPCGQRLVQAVAVLAGLGDVPAGSSQWEATRAAWNHRGVEGAIPQFRGIVQEHDEHYVWLTVTGQLLDHRDRLDYLGSDIAELPDIAPMESRKSLAEIGLAAISATNLSEVLGGDIWDIGGYHPAATVVVPTPAAS